MASGLDVESVLCMEETGKCWAASLGARFFYFRAGCVRDLYMTHGGTHGIIFAFWSIHDQVSGQRRVVSSLMALVMWRQHPYSLSVLRCVPCSVVNTWFMRIFGVRIVRGGASYSNQSQASPDHVCLPSQRHAVAVRVPNTAHGDLSE